ncbi:hypothetical protein [Haematobacter sp. UBA3484]|uniref:hypothetical protein n=1 Tax=Haematobacter sp. UBA3484 TaxID=1946582 RepID=UPI0025B9266F|nr:hypothetical protein [Haematobacter sp. UBA3484]
MEPSSETASLSDKLMGPVTVVIDKRRADLLPMLQAGPGQAAQMALLDDECVRKVATFCYPLLPVLIRLAVKEPTFISFVLNNREKVLGSLAAPA